MLVPPCATPGYHDLRSVAIRLKCFLNVDVTPTMVRMIRYSTFPRTEPPPEFAESIVQVFRAQEPAISTGTLQKGLTSDRVLSTLAVGLEALGFVIEAGKLGN